MKVRVWRVKEWFRLVSDRWLNGEGRDFCRGWLGSLMTGINEEHQGQGHVLLYIYIYYISFGKGIAGLICGTEGIDSSGLSLSTAVGVAYLLALESANNLTVSPTENIEYDQFGFGFGFTNSQECVLSMAEEGFLASKRNKRSLKPAVVGQMECARCRLKKM